MSMFTTHKLEDIGAQGPHPASRANMTHGLLLHPEKGNGPRQFEASVVDQVSLQASKSYVKHGFYRIQLSPGPFLHLQTAAVTAHAYLPLQGHPQGLPPGVPQALPLPGAHPFPCRTAPPARMSTSTVERSTVKAPSSAVERLHHMQG
eukprot:scaffold176384_cov25-Tisochrysis_lutea.AAC.1